MCSLRFQIAAKSFIVLYTGTDHRRSAYANEAVLVIKVESEGMARIYLCALIAILICTINQEVKSCGAVPVDEFF